MKPLQLNSGIGTEYVRPKRCNVNYSKNGTVFSRAPTTQGLLCLLLCIPRGKSCYLFCETGTFRSHPHAVACRPCSRQCLALGFSTHCPLEEIR